VTVPYTLAVPADAEPGDHPGALVALDERIQAGRGSVAVGVQRAVGARVYLRVNGPTVPALAVEDGTLDPKVAPRAEGFFGRTLLVRDLEKIPSELLPRQKIRLTERWTGSPQFDWGQVTLTATAKDVRESGRASFLALPWLAAAVVLTGGVVALIGLRVRRRRALGT
jgi:hypothetical protein